jgi:hypothetical protein
MNSHTADKSAIRCARTNGLFLASFMSTERCLLEIPRTGSSPAGPSCCQKPWLRGQRSGSSFRGQNKVAVHLDPGTSWLSMSVMNWRQSQQTAASDEVFNSGAYRGLYERAARTYGHHIAVVREISVCRPKSSYWAWV